MQDSSATDTTSIIVQQSSPEVVCQRSAHRETLLFSVVATA
jgi:hypothetical protein